MKEKPKIRELNSSEMEEVRAAVSFHNAAYGTNRTPEQWLWEYQGQIPKGSVFAIIEDEKRIVGTQGMIPITVNMDGLKYLSGKSENTLLSPQYRGGTGSKELYEYAISLCMKNNMAFVWGFTPAEKVWRNKFGFATYNVMFYSFLIVSPLKFASFMKSRRPTTKWVVTVPLVWCTYLYSSILRTYRRMSLKDSTETFAIEHNLRNICDLKMLYNRLRKRYPKLIYIDQDETYLKWRILENPNVAYEMYFLYDWDILRAYCYITRSNCPNDSGGEKNAAFITDFTFESRNAGSYLLGAILKTLGSGREAYLYFLGNGQNRLIREVFAVLKSFGFLKRRAAPFVYRNILENDNEDFYKIENWYLNGIWTEGYE